MKYLELGLIVASALSAFAPLDYNMGSTEPVKYESMIPESTVTNPVAIVYVRKDGLASEMQMEEFGDLAIRWQVTNHPDWVKDLPTTHYKRGEKWYQATGFITKKRLESLLNPPAPIVKKRVVKRQAGYQIRFDSRQWTWPGDIRTHLLGGMHGFTAEELRGYSTRDLIRIHNYEHENGRPRLNYGWKTSTSPQKRVTYQRQGNFQRQTSVYCPT